jgi:hypothetical protein
MWIEKADLQVGLTSVPPRSINVASRHGIGRRKKRGVGYLVLGNASPGGHHHHSGLP